MSKHTIALAYDASLPLSRYVEIVRLAKADFTARFRRTFSGFWPGTSADILRQFREGVHDRINKRGGLIIREANSKRIDAERERRVISECRWCGSSLGGYRVHHARFCDASCRHDYHH
jgi:hypothetical protein